LSAAYAESERVLLAAAAALDPLDASPLAEAARLWQAAKRMARFSPGWTRHGGTGPCPEIAHALRAAEAVLHVRATGRADATPHDDADSPAAHWPHVAKPNQPDDASFEFVAHNTDTWVVRDCEEEHGCTVVERLHRQEVREAARDGREPEPVQVIDVPPDLCGLVGRALVSRAARAADQKRRAESA
jgi:hypothetical protein